MPIFKQFDADDIVSANPTEVTIGLWPGAVGTLTSITKTSQSGSTSGQFYWDVYDSGSVNNCFSVAYGHRTGGGHPTLIQDNNSTLATKATYSQYRNLLLDPGDTRFTFDDAYESDHIYVVNIQRSLFKERLDPGNWELRLSGSNGAFTFIDDSGQSLGSSFGRTGKVFNIVSGALGGVEGATIAPTQSAVGGFGLFYPSLGVMVFNPDALGTTVGITAPTTGSSATPTYNHSLIYEAIRLGNSFQARSAENIASSHYFVRLRAREFNYSNNPTFFDEVDGSLIYTGFINDPRVYVTTVGLYNNENECLAVAKLSQPVQKGFDRELNLRVRLDY